LLRNYKAKIGEVESRPEMFDQRERRAITRYHRAQRTIDTLEEEIATLTSENEHLKADLPSTASVSTCGTQQLAETIHEQENVISQVRLQIQTLEREKAADASARQELQDCHDRDVEHHTKLVTKLRKLAQ